VETITRLFDLLHLYRGPLASQEAVFAGKRGGKWRSFSANDYCRISDQVSASLLEAGVGKGTKVATIMQNCPEWNFLDMGLLQIGAVQVPIYPTICNEHFWYLFEHADVEYVFIYDHTNYKCISAILPEFPAIKGVISIRHIDGVTNWNDFLEQGSKNADPKKIRTISDQIKPNDLTTIIYTSGTTGTGKGVMLSHNNFVSNFIAAQTILAPKPLKLL
jgi:long-chain acyl-CoA synthetase